MVPISGKKSAPRPACAKPASENLVNRRQFIDTLGGLAGGLLVYNLARAATGVTSLATTLSQSEKPFVLLPRDKAVPPRELQAKVTGEQSVLISQFYNPMHGANIQPATQAAIDFANRSKIKNVINDTTSAGRTAEMWCPPRRSPWQSKAPDGIPVVINNDIDLDFRGTFINLFGPNRSNRSQRLPGEADAWLGGWLRIVGHSDFGHCAIRNVSVNGRNKPNNYRANSERNLSDKGISVWDTKLKSLELSNVDLRNFAAEIYYIGGPGPDEQYLSDCSFIGSPQCAFNPGGTGRLKALRLRAGRSYQAAEIIGGRGHSYEDCSFFDSTITFIMGGPSPGFVRGCPYFVPIWDGSGDKPWVDFKRTAFNNVETLYITAWMRGEIRTVDTRIALASQVGHVRDIDLAVESVISNRADYPALALSGPSKLGENVGSGQCAYTVEPPSNIRFRIDCRRSSSAVRRGLKHSAVASIYGDSIIDQSSVLIEARGVAKQVLLVQHQRINEFREPRIANQGVKLVA